MGWGELVRRDLTGEVRKTPEALLSDEIKNQLLNFSESKYLSKEMLIYDDRDGVKYYKIPNTDKAAIAELDSYAHDVLPFVEDETKEKWTVVAICSKERYFGDHYLGVPKTIKQIVLSGSYSCHGRRFKVDPDNPFYQSDDSGALFTKDGSVLLSLTARSKDNIVIPSSVKKVDRLLGECTDLRFEGQLPEFGEIIGIHTEKIYVNQPLKEIPRDRYKMISDIKIGNKEWRTAQIITKKPVLSTAVPTAPGFIGLTRVDNDEYEYINPRYIIKMEPVSFEKYDGEEKGTRVYFAAHGSERAIAVDYYEKLLDVDDKIKEAQEVLAQSIGGLAGLLEKVNDLYKLSQKERF